MLVHSIWSSLKVLISLREDISVTDEADEVADDNESLQKQLADARMEEQNAMAEYRRYETLYYDAAWAKAIEKVKRLEAKIPKRLAQKSGR